MEHRRTGCCVYWKESASKCRQRVWQWWWGGREGEEFKSSACHKCQLLPQSKTPDSHYLCGFLHSMSADMRHDPKTFNKLEFISYFYLCRISAQQMSADMRHDPDFQHDSLSPGSDDASSFFSSLIDRRQGRRNNKSIPTMTADETRSISRKKAKWLQVDHFIH